MTFGNYRKLKLRSPRFLNGTAIGQKCDPSLDLSSQGLTYRLFYSLSLPDWLYINSPESVTDIAVPLLYHFLMHTLVIEHLAANHEHVVFETKDFDAGLGWVEMIDELCKDLPAGTVIHWIREIDGRLQISATGESIVTHMLLAIWRRSAAICPHCGDLRHPNICLP